MHASFLPTRVALRCILLALAALPPACGSASNGGDADGGGATEMSCAHTVSTICDKIAACNPHALRALYGDARSCVERNTPGCATRLPGTSWTASRFDACARAFEQASCGRTMEPDDFIPACNSTPGSLADGARCSSDAQCAGGACDKGDPSLSATCGTCRAAPPKPGCGGGAECTPPTLCARVSSGIMCVAPQMEGAACGVGAVCEPGLLCKAGVCSKRASSGAACVTSGDCDSSQGLFCIDGTCQVPRYAEAGGACDDKQTFCERGAECRLTGVGTGTCVAPAADGASCADGTPCLEPARCRDGICRVLDGSECN